MIRPLILFLSLAFSLNVRAVDNDFGSTDSRGKNLSPVELRDRFELGGEIFIADGAGKLLLQSGETRSWKFGPKGEIRSNWSFVAPGMKEIALAHTWSIDDDGKIIAHIREFDSMKRANRGQEVSYGKLLREEKIEVKDFAPITWKVKQESGETVVVRLTPRLLERPEPREVSGLAIALDNPVVFDNKGRLWSAGGSLEGEFIYMRTYLGQFAASFRPFKGAKEIGTARDGELELREGDLKLFVRSARLIVAGNRAVKVYGIVDTGKKTDRMNMVRSGASDSEKGILSHLD